MINIHQDLRRTYTDLQVLGHFSTGFILRRQTMNLNMFGMRFPISIFRVTQFDLPDSESEQTEQRPEIEDDENENAS